MKYRIRPWRNGYDGGIMYGVQVRVLGFLWIPRTDRFDSLDDAQKYVENLIQRKQG